MKETVHALGLFLMIFSWQLLLASCDSSKNSQQQSESPSSQKSAINGQADADAVAANNRGVALMGQYQYQAAYDEFATLIEQYPGWPEVEVNLAIAQMNRQTPGDEEAASQRLDRVLLDDPKLLRARYTAALLAWYVGDVEIAKEHFERVVNADPSDAFAAYYLGQCAMEAGNYREALKWFDRASQTDPYLRSTYYGKVQAYQRLRQTDEAAQALVIFNDLANNPRSMLAEIKYTRMGPKAEAEVVDFSGFEKAPAPSGDIFASPVALGSLDQGNIQKWSVLPGRPSVSMTLADMNGDGRVDLFIAGARGVDSNTNLVYLQQPDGTLAPGVSPLSNVDQVNAALWGDVDSNGLTDAYLLREGANQLWLQVNAGVFENVTEESKTEGGDFNTVDGALFDADHDGDLDLFLVNVDGPSELLNNDRTGVFRALGKSQELAGRGQGGRQVLIADLDADRDTDIAVFYDEPPHEVFYNDLGWSYRPADGFQYLESSAVDAAVAGDIDADGEIDLLTMDVSGNLRRWQPDDSGVWRAGGGSGPLDETHLAPLRLAIADVNGDGVMDIVGPDASGAWSVQGRGLLKSDNQGLLAGTPHGPLLVGWTLAVLDASQGPSIIGLPAEGQPIIWSPGPGRFPFVTVSLSGREDTASSMRSNASGIGSLMAARVGSSWIINHVLRSSSGPGQSLQPIPIGLGGADRVDFVSIDWSDGVYQTELDLAPGKQHKIVETQRQLASCPVLFVFDGESYQFVSDVLGVAGLGFWVGPNQTAPFRSFENFLLPPDLLKSDGSGYRIKIGEPMEEVCYLDAVRLVAYDVPDGVSMFLDERMGTGKPLPTGKALFYKHPQLPVHATSKDGDEVTSLLAEADQQAVSPGALDDRFIGLLQEPACVTIVFGEPLDGQVGDPWLLIDGWIEYPYSQTHFAAWQAVLKYESLTIEARGADGQWYLLHDKVGYPAGMPRLASIPLMGIPQGSTALRLSTTQEIYLDRVQVVWAEPCESCDQNTALLSRADLMSSGFPERTTGDQRLPGYDDMKRVPFWDTKAQAGWYTELGSVEPLLESKDSAVAIIGTGEEVELCFDLLPDVPDGYHRYFVVETDGWCKDMDLYTHDGETVLPLPSLEQFDAAHVDGLHERFNSRYRSGR